MDLCTLVQLLLACASSSPIVSIIGVTRNRWESRSLLESGLIDSMGVLELVTFLESEFPITIADDEMLPTNLDTIGAIVAFIQRKTALNKVA